RQRKGTRRSRRWGGALERDGRERVRRERVRRERVRRGRARSCRAAYVRSGACPARYGAVRRGTARYGAVRRVGRGTARAVFTVRSLARGGRPSVASGGACSRGKARTSTGSMAHLSAV